MEGQELNALPKVTTLSDGDTLLAIDSGGGGKRISRDALVNQDVAREYISSTSVSYTHLTLPTTTWV